MQMRLDPVMKPPLLTEALDLAIALMEQMRLDPVMKPLRWP